MLLATDGSPCSRLALDQTANLAAAAEADVMVLVVSDMVFLRPSYGLEPELLVPSNAEAADILQEAFAFLKARGIRARTLHRVGPAPEIIVSVAREEKADMIVVGSHGRSGLQRFLLGSVSEKVLAHAPCTVLITRAPRQNGMEARGTTVLPRP
ncbi:MAG TPA: universal stress protein [Stenomitos sp.]